MPLILATLLLAVGAGYGKPGLTGKVAGGRVSTTQTLAVQPCSGPCDLQFVADDWSGSGNWASRVGSWTATVTGTPTKQATTQFTARSEITGFTDTSAFRLAAKAAHTIQNSDAVSYEWIVKTPSAVTTTKALGGYVSTSNTQIFNMSFINSLGGNLESAVYNNAVGVFMGTANTATAWQMPSRYNMFTVVVDTTAPRYEVYINGASVFESATTNGTMTPTNTDFGIGARWNGGFSAFGSACDEGCTLVEFTRYRAAFVDGTVAVRAATFNTVKGY